MIATISQQLDKAMANDDLYRFRELLLQHPERLRRDDGLVDWLWLAVRSGQIRFIQCLIEECGVDANEPTESGGPEGTLEDAAGFNQLEIARYLLDHGAQLNHEVDGTVRCLALSNAVLSGNIDMVRLFVERGAAINTTFSGVNPLSHARDYDKREIEEYLRSKGAKLPYELVQRDIAGGHKAIIEHVSAYRGKAKRLTIPHIVPGNCPIAIYLAEPHGKFDSRTIFTLGVSDEWTKSGHHGEGFLEFAMQLPLDWPISKAELTKPTSCWPFEWLLRIATATRKGGVWAGDRGVIFTNNEPPEPVAPNTKLSCFLSMIGETSFDHVFLPDYRNIDFVSIHPIYTEERDLEKTQGTTHLVKLFQKYDILLYIDPHRRNVAL